MTVISKFKYNQKWTPIEQQLINYITQHPQEIKDLSVKELADASQTSLSTIYRLCDKLEVKGYNELKYLFLTEYQENNKSEVDVNIPFTSSSTDYSIMESMKAVYKQTIDETMSLINLDTLRICAQILDKAHTINIYTST